jgi:hypothetical protein
MRLPRVRLTVRRPNWIAAGLTLGLVTGFGVWADGPTANSRPNLLVLRGMSESRLSIAFTDDGGHDLKLIVKVTPDGNLAIENGGLKLTTKEYALLWYRTNSLPKK